MELFQLKQFLIIAESESLREAADRMYLSASALSQNLHKLEDELGCPLFERSRNRLVITPFGKILKEHAESVFNELADAQGEIEREKLARERILRVGHFSLPMTYIRMPRLAQSLPDYTFDVDVRPVEELMQGLADEHYDFIIAPPAKRLPTGLTGITIEKERACLSVPAGSKIYGEEQVSMSDLAGEKFLVVDDMLGLSEWYARLINCIGSDDVDVKYVHETDYLSEMGESDRIHFSTNLMIDFLGLGNDRRRVEIEDALANRSISMIYRHSEKERLKDVIARFKRHAGKPYESSDAFPYLVFPSSAPNLAINIV